MWISYRLRAPQDKMKLSVVESLIKRRKSIADIIDEIKPFIVKLGKTKISS